MEVPVEEAEVPGNLKKYVVIVKNLNEIDYLEFFKGSLFIIDKVYKQINLKI